MKTFCQGGGGPAEPVPYLVPSDWTTKNVRVKAEPVASATLGLRLALNATARACAEERAGIAGLITLRQSLPTYRGCASGTPHRALDSTQGKPCSVALLGLAFTMAEILLSLTIIGVVAAITLPSLTGNINERTWNTQRKALYARLSQAVALMPSLNGYGTLTEESSSGAGDAVDTAAETFVTDGLSKVLKINNICDYEHLEDCGIPSNITAMNGDNISPFPTKMSELNDAMVNISWNDYSSGGHSYSQLDTKAAAFETANGESISVFYNPNCMPDFESRTTIQVQPYICANFVYDLNGNKGPNTVGKDIGFITVYDASDSVVVAPVPLMSDAGTYRGDEAAKACRAQDSESRLPNLQETMALFVNRDLIGNLSTSSGVYWTSKLSINAGNPVVTYGSMKSGHTSVVYRTGSAYVRCIKR